MFALGVYDEYASSFPSADTEMPWAFTPEVSRSASPAGCLPIGRQPDRKDAAPAAAARDEQERAAVGHPYGVRVEPFPRRDPVGPSGGDGSHPYGAGFCVPQAFLAKREDHSAAHVRDF